MSGGLIYSFVCCTFYRIIWKLFYLELWSISLDHNTSASLVSGFLVGSRSEFLIDLNDLLKTEWIFDMSLICCPVRSVLFSLFGNNLFFIFVRRIYRIFMLGTAQDRVAHLLNYSNFEKEIGSVSVSIDFSAFFPLSQFSSFFAKVF